MGHQLDFKGDEKIKDGLVVKLHLGTAEYSVAYSGQKLLKFGYYEPIEDAQRQIWLDRIIEQIPEKLISEIEMLLEHPTQEALRSLVWIPPRFKNQYQNPNDKQNHNQ